MLWTLEEREAFWSRMADIEFKLREVRHLTWIFPASFAVLYWFSSSVLAYFALYFSMFSPFLVLLIGELAKNRKSNIAIHLRKKGLTKRFIQDG